MHIVRCSKFDDKDYNIQMEWICFRFGQLKQYKLPGQRQKSLFGLGKCFRDYDCLIIAVIIMFLSSVSLLLLSTFAWSMKKLWRK